MFEQRKTFVGPIQLISASARGYMYMWMYEIRPPEHHFLLASFSSTLVKQQKTTPSRVYRGTRKAVDKNEMKKLNLTCRIPQVVVKLSAVSLTMVREHHIASLRFAAECELSFRSHKGDGGTISLHMYMRSGLVLESGPFRSEHAVNIIKMDPIAFVEQNNVLFMLGGTVLVVSVVVTALLVRAELGGDVHGSSALSFFRERVERQPVIGRTSTTSMKDAIHGSVPAGDVSGKFVIPRFSRTNQSMFTNPQQSQFDRGLYQCTPPDESACTDEMGASGSIQLSLSLDANLGLLTVSLKQACDLPSKRQDDNPNPYFRVSLDIPDGAKTQQQTKTFRATTSPEIGEDFYFQAGDSEL
ncbi:unnamed protein product [Nippostrongylus brasiliensis]|uniref:C2 domain-containing protein n=1 Tax=Nippostrongylus brasiliensis TaxID=27835 RepID=A0A0N4Y126_NIPBR|nr:unnamed protein product [Nippostrongylus brasiliensis]